MNKDKKIASFVFSFLVGGDGRVYEGTGWHKEGAHTYGYNNRSIGIGVIGNFTGERNCYVENDFCAFDRSFILFSSS